MHLQGNIFVVTGGASGLGHQVVKSIVEQDGYAIIMDINATGANKAVQSLGSDKVYSSGSVDVTSEEQVQRAIKGGLSYFNSNNKDKESVPSLLLAGAVLCSGIVLSPQKIQGYGPDKHLTSYSQFKHVLSVNLLGTYNVAQQVAQTIIENNKPLDEDGERGIIITTSSMLGLDGTLVGYGTSKAGIAGMTLPLARELASFGIRVMSIAPGPFETPMKNVLPGANPPVSLFPKRHGYPHEFSDLVLQIITNPMLNGSVIRLDGGLRG
ncbi:short-chain dehydrogenase/reductase SDR [Phascolomyces articulosus]|uniref:Short-chain dehydrogenase/reductase SDR n=1 Tax=Phascolomyces articulosus TaxID=60185 RepID=A0AAD5JU71_9FUNG|nr:short-chain dehydrogenase/reductase SDR [Phascolomyces articulosus]